MVLGMGLSVGSSFTWSVIIGRTAIKFGTDTHGPQWVNSEFGDHLDFNIAPPIGLHLYFK